MPPNSFVKTVIHLIFQDSQMNRKFKRTAFTVFEILIFCNIIFTVTFIQFNASLLYKRIHLNNKQMSMHELQNINCQTFKSIGSRNNNI